MIQEVLQLREHTLHTAEMGHPRQLGDLCRLGTL